MAKIGRVLVAGSTGYLGWFIVKALRQQYIDVVAMVLPSTPAEKRAKLTSVGASIVEADACQPLNLVGVCAGVHTVVSCLAAAGGQRQGTIWQVDRDANIALFDEAARAGVEHFVLIGTFEGREARSYSELSRAKEEAVDHITQRAQQLGMRCSIVRPVAYFKDLTDWPWSAVRDKGSITLIGSGSSRYNPIHGAEAAEFIAHLVLHQQPPRDYAAAAAAAGGPAAPRSGTSAATAAEGKQPASAAGRGQEEEAVEAGGSQAVAQYPLGGPEVLTLPDIVATAAMVQGKDPRSINVLRVPLWLARLLAALCRLLGHAGYEPARRLADGLEFAVFSSSHHAVAPAFGSKTVRQYYLQEKLVQ